ncbi:MAG: FKBP-type peptidyl-prolyl cis-trans isomerase [Ilumatobacter sp.]|uniref:FKBP-type peptidyl-prolyl cis-trans isomerase n=1 Tax=Ilumatobacter sp. TaxID=1967498 RepID=UPI003C7179CC
MRRTLAISAFIALSLAACGGSETSTPVSLPPAEGAADSAPETTVPEDLCVPVGGEAPEPDIAAPEVLETNPDKPEIDIPTEAPTELDRTVLEEGSGDAAEAGDTVIVDYAGVRSSDGLPFDNSYDRGEPFPVVLGQGGVIEGWDVGLIGSQTGERVQLDIPSAQAYGEVARSNIICENEDLTFVIDVRAVVKAVDPGDVPTEPGVELSKDPGVDDTVFEDLVVGDGEVLEIDDTAVIRYVNFRGDTGEVLETSWDADPLQVVYGENLLPGLLEGMEGLAVGGRRAITVPPEDGFGEEGSPDAGLPAGTDMIFVVELIGKY